MAKLKNQAKGPPDVEMGVKEYEACEIREVITQTYLFETQKSNTCANIRGANRVNREVTQQIGTKITKDF